MGETDESGGSGKLSNMSVNIINIYLKGKTCELSETGEKVNQVITSGAP